MRLVSFSIMVLIALSLSFVPQINATTITLGAKQDNTLYEQAEGSLSNGIGAHFFVGKTRLGLIRRGVISFDIAGSIPAESRINGVDLTLHMSRSTSGSHSVNLHLILNDWGEGTSNSDGNEGAGVPATPDDATWAHTFFDGSFWANEGGDFSPIVSASETISGVDFYTWGSTTQMIADVQSWLDTPLTNFGWLLLGNEAVSRTTKRFDSRENINQDFRPLLTVDFTPILSDPIPDPISQGENRIKLSVVTSGLTAPNWGIFAPGDVERLFVTDQKGILWVIKLATGEKSVFLDVSDKLVSLGIGGENTFDERGLLGVAFHPEYSENGLLYTYTSEPLSGAADFSTMPQGAEANHQSVITEWMVPDPTDPESVVASNSDRELIRIDQPQFNHNAGAINFGSDGMLYIALGDGGSADDQGVGHGAEGNGQNPRNVLGSILRIDALGLNSANGQYGIPAANPFVDQEGFVEEIFAYGFRNPFRFSFDLLTGDLFVADVGQNDIEEVNKVIAGGNYGWNFKEGTFFFDPNGDDRGFVTDDDPGNVPENLIDPVAQYDHDEGISVIGGFVYRGKIDRLKGKYVFGDWSRTFFGNDGRLFYLDGEEILEFQITNAAGQSGLGLSLLGFGQDASGEIYVLGNSTGIPFGETGVVLKITALCDGDGDGDGDVDGLDLSGLATSELDENDLETLALEFGRNDC